ncbi:6-bladed beta-propeller [Parabacteroides sp. PF5-6]|uniref:6-bladed beta-propeller n=1 Tax=Parabacteroides sp. PF5-6 TaxID=1742403 RepID=UPI0024049D32|nr:6-bladed beta-propeller [Parabacteroides sp. PF5-6]MDF9828725.1 hypothetical protein [Parabacteroides sp. PF5-6]
MRVLISYFCFAWLLLIGLVACAPKEKTVVQEVVTIDASREYPEKKMLLQDMAEVDYIRLETSDEMLWKGGVKAFTDNYILNQNLSTGDILLFDKTGKIIRKINHQGGSGEEYSPYSSALFDEENEELYVNDTDKRKIFVYDLEGNFKRVLDFVPDKYYYYSSLHLFDAKHLIVYNDAQEDEEDNSYLILSKQTGEIEKEIIIPPTSRKLFLRHTLQSGGETMTIVFMNYPLAAAHPKLILTEISNDTIFSLNQAMELKPIIVQKPSRSTMEHETFLFYTMESNNYIFLSATAKKFIGEGYNTKAIAYNLIYDKKEAACYQQDVRNGDFTPEKKVYIPPVMPQLSLSNKNVFLQILNAGDLVEAYENNQLTGRLKEIAKELDEEDNPVILVARFK